MLHKPLRGWLLLAVLAASPPTAGAQEVSEPLARVEVLLTVAPTLPAVVRATLLEETAAIWRQQHVAIEWLSPDDTLTPAANRLRAVVVERRAMALRVEGTFPIGELFDRPTATRSR